MFTWFKRVAASLAFGFIGAVTVPFLSIEVYRLLLDLGTDNHQILIRLSNKYQTPAESFARETIFFGAVLGVMSGYMLAAHHEREFRKVWTLSTISSLFAMVFLYALWVHPLAYVLGKQEKYNGLSVMITSFAIPALWSVLLLLWGYNVHGSKLQKWKKQEVRVALMYFLVVTLINTMVD